MKQRTLDERIQARWLRSGKDNYYTNTHVRAELQRVVRSHRKSAETLRAKALFDRVERERKAKLKQRRQ